MFENKKNITKRTVWMIAIGVCCLNIKVAFCQDKPQPVADPNASAAPQTQLEAEITLVTGKHVQYTLDKVNWLPAKVGIKLPGDASVRTGFASTCEISFRGHTVVRVEDLSSVRIAEYLGNEKQETVRTNLQYGAVRCGVEEGRIKSDTTISTPVALLAIRGTVTQVEYDRGTAECRLGVLSGGPADAISRRGRYPLQAGMNTNGQLNRYLQTAITERFVSVTGNVALGGLTPDEAGVLAQLAGGSLLQGDDPTSLLDRVRDRLSIIRDILCPGGECDPGPSQ
ncbi:MAG: FecR domain-containing protein [Sedimentisphaerales bacterium]|nr:FecR domain-containing protein [Sedimentisphaerales bacterium]